MNGIFNYQVPGQAPATTPADKGQHGRGCADNAPRPFSGNNAAPGSELSEQLLTLLSQLLQQLQNGHGKPEPDVTTLALGEEDGGGFPHPVDKPDATTLAVGEEDGGGFPQPVDKPGKPDVTTLALGEEDGGLNGPVI
ncbi:MAG: hypothetical protein R3E95_16775 [Thiolinea sp.]